MRNNGIGGGNGHLYECQCVYMDIVIDIFVNCNLVDI